MFARSLALGLALLAFAVMPAAADPSVDVVRSANATFFITGANGHAYKVYFFARSFETTGKDDLRVFVTHCTPFCKRTSTALGRVLRPGEFVIDDDIRTARLDAVIAGQRLRATWQSQEDSDVPKGPTTITYGQDPALAAARQDRNADAITGFASMSCKAKDATTSVWARAWLDLDPPGDDMVTEFPRGMFVAGRGRARCATT